MKQNWKKNLITAIKVIVAIFLVVYIHELAHYLVFTAFGAQAKMTFIPPMFPAVRVSMTAVTMPNLALMLGSLAGPLANLLTALVAGLLIKKTAREIYDIMIEYADYFYWQIKNNTSHLFKSIVGPVGIVKLLHEYSLGEIIFILGIGLGFFNLIPFPPLDGWKIVSPVVRLIIPRGLVDIIEITCTLLFGVFFCWIIIKDVLFFKKQE